MYLHTCMRTYLILMHYKGVLAHWWYVRVVWVPDGALVDCMWLYSSVQLNKDLRYLLTIILAGYEPCMVHIKVHFTSSLSPWHFSWIPCPPSNPPIVEFAWYYHLEGNPSGKTTKLVGNLFLATSLLRGWFEGKELWLMVKFGTRSFSHWRATAL